DSHLCSGPRARSSASGRAFRHVSPRDGSPPRVHRALFVLGPVVWTRAGPDAQPAFLEDPRRVEISLGPLAKIAARWSLAKDVTAGTAVVLLRRTTTAPPGVDRQSTHPWQEPEAESYQPSAGYATSPVTSRSMDRRPQLAPRSLDPGAARPVDWDYRLASAIIV